jgi:integrase
LQSDNIVNSTHQDYFILLLLTRLRKRAATTLNWENVDLKAGTLTVLETKNSQAHTLFNAQFIAINASQH